MTEEQKFVRTSFHTDQEVYKQFKIWTVKNCVSIKEYFEQEIKKHITMTDISKDDFNINLSYNITKPFVIDKEILKELNIWLVKNDISLKNLMNKIMLNALE